MQARNVITLSISAWLALNLHQAFAQEASTKEDIARAQMDLGSRNSADAKIVSSDADILQGRQDLYDLNTKELQALGVTKDELDDSTAPWEMFAKKLRTLYNNDPTWTGMQVLGLPTAADWNDDNLGKWRKWRVIGDTIPVWGSSYIPTSKQVSKGYEILIDNIAIPQPNPADQAAAEAARTLYNSDSSTLEKLQEDVGSHWKLFDSRQSSLPQPRRLSFDQWYRQFDGAKIGQHQIKLNGDAQKYQSYINSAYKGFGWAANLVMDYNNTAFQLSAPSDDGLTLTYRTYNFTPDLQQFIDQSKTLGGNCSKLNIAYDHTTHHDHSEDEGWSGGASYGFGFFSFGVSASGGRQSFSVSDGNFKMHFCAVNLALFTIQPGGWFNGTAVSALANGPWLPDGPIAKGTISLYGPNGVFNLMPTQILVAFRPSVTVSLSKHDYDMVHTSFNAGGGFSIGPFGFGGSYHKDTRDVRWDDATNTITAADSSDIPQIVAVISNKLPNNR